jgi:hypothetical protein
MMADAIDAQTAHNGKAPDECLGSLGIIGCRAVPDFHEGILHHFLGLLALTKHAHRNAEQGWSPEIV